MLFFTHWFVPLIKAVFSCVVLSAVLGISIISSLHAMDPLSTIGILGGGQLGRMLVQSASDLGIEVNILDSENAPAKQISAHAGHIDGSFKSPGHIKALAQHCDILTTEIEHIDTYALEEVAEDVKIEPSWKTLRIIQDKYEQRNFLRQSSAAGCIPMAEYRELHQNSMEELGRIGEELGYPLMLKAKTQAYDGRGMMLTIQCKRLNRSLIF